MKIRAESLTAPETVSCGLLILARIIAREATSARLVRCGAERQVDSDFQLERSPEMTVGI